MIILLRHLNGKFIFPFKKQICTKNLHRQKVGFGEGDYGD